MNMTILYGIIIQIVGFPHPCLITKGSKGYLVFMHFYPFRLGFRSLVISGLAMDRGRVGHTGPKQEKGSYTSWNKRFMWPQGLSWTVTLPCWPCPVTQFPHAQGPSRDRKAKVLQRDETREPRSKVLLALDYVLEHATEGSAEEAPRESLNLARSWKTTQDRLFLYLIPPSYKIANRKYWYVTGYVWWRFFREATRYIWST